jgi:hypothetical protein
VIGLVLVYRTQGRRMLRGPATAPLALLVAALVFLFVTATFRSGAPGALAELTVIGPERAQLGRYVYVVAALTLPAIALALDAIVRRRKYAAIAAVAALVIGIPGNISRFADYTGNARYIANGKAALLGAAASPLAGAVPRTLRPVPAYAQPVTLGWLLDNRRAGRLPSDAFLTKRDRATSTLNLTVQPSTHDTSAFCAPLTQPILIVVNEGDVITVRKGVVVLYLLAFVDRSQPRLLLPDTSVEAIAGPLRLALTPAPPRPGRARGVVCTNRKITPERGNVFVPRAPAAASG